MQKNIIFLSRLFHPHQGGVERHVYELSRKLITHGYLIIVVTEQYDQHIELEEDWEGIHILRIPYPNLQSKQGVWRWMRDNRSLFDQAEVIHAHDVFWWYWPLRLSLPNKKVFTTFHGYEGNNPPTIKAVLQRKAAELASTGSICIGDFMRKWYFAHPDYVLYGASSLNNQSSHSIGNKQIVFWGRLDFDTGVDVYVEAMQQLPDWKLHVYGTGPLESKLPQLSNVSYHPWNPTIAAESESFQVAFVSRYLSILEAMQSGKLVVAVYNNAIKRDYLLCHPMSKQMIIAGSAAEVVNRLQHIDTEEIQNQIRAARAWAKQQTWDKVADVYLQLWNQ